MRSNATPHDLLPATTCGRLLVGPLIAGVAVTVGMAVAPSAGTAATSGASAETTSCAAFAKHAARSTGPKGTTARRQLKRCKDTNRANKLVLALVRDSHLVGTRANGSLEDWTFCANGRYDLRTTSGGSTGTSNGTRWRVADAVYRSDSTFTAVLEDPSKGTSVGVARKAGAWKVATSRSFGQLEDIGPAERTAATSCNGQ